LQNPLPKGYFGPAFRQSRPVLLTTFTNKVGSIGLSLIPILLVRRGVSTAEGSLVLSLLKITILAGTLAGGALCDRFSSRTLVLTALLLSATGLGFLPFQKTLGMIILFGVLGQIAEALLNVVQRLLLMGQVDSSLQKEALGWLRMVNNFAQIFSYSVGAAAARFGVMPLMLFDSATSLGAFCVGRKILPPDDSSAEGHGRGLAGGKGGAPASKTAFFSFALVLMGWALFYELFLEGGAGRLEALHPGEGLRRFSYMMVLNTTLCAAFSVRAAKFFEKSWAAITGGLVLTAAGIIIAAWGMASQAWVLGGMLLITLGEMMLGAVAQYTLMRMTPGEQNSGFSYSLGLTLMQCGRIAGAALAFPLLIHAADLSIFTRLIAGGLAILLAVLWALREQITRLA
jgi:predicted MFS family arabinose efflux permease